MHGRVVTLFDATEDPEFQRGLATALAGGALAESDHDVRWIVEPESATRLVLPEGAAIRVSSAEQSNTSIVFDRVAILKVFRKLERGVHPDVEISQFLTRQARFARTPTVLATIRFEEGTGGGATSSNGSTP